MSEKSEKQDAGNSVTVNSSGSISVDLGSFLKSTEGQNQLTQIRELRTFTRSEASGTDKRRTG